MFFPQESCENLVEKIQKIKQKKQELIDRLKLHEAVSQFKTSFQTVKSVKRVKTVKPKRKSGMFLINLQNVIYFCYHAFILLENIYTNSVILNF